MNSTALDAVPQQWRRQTLRARARVPGPSHEGLAPATVADPIAHAVKQARSRCFRGASDAERQSIAVALALDSLTPNDMTSEDADVVRNLVEVAWFIKKASRRWCR